MAQNISQSSPIIKYLSQNRTRTMGTRNSLQKRYYYSRGARRSQTQQGQNTLSPHQSIHRRQRALQDHPDPLDSCIFCQGSNPATHTRDLPGRSWLPTQTDCRSSGRFFGAFAGDLHLQAAVESRYSRLDLPALLQPLPQQLSD